MPSVGDTDPVKLTDVGGLIQNLGPDDLYIQESDEVDSDSGVKLAVGDAAAVSWGATFYGISSDTSDVRILPRGVGFFPAAVAPA